MSKGTNKLINAPSKTDNKSGGGRGNKPPAPKPAAPKPAAPVKAKP